MKLALIQMGVSPNKEQNLARAREMVLEAAAAGQATVLAGDTVWFITVE